VLEAAQKLGRHAIGIEIEERYCAPASARLSRQ
jgi:DNA modification methylase